MLTCVSKQGKGQPIVAHNETAVTATSNEIDCTGFNAAIVHVVVSGSGTWKVDIQGATGSGLTFVDLYDNNDSQLTTGNITASRGRLFVGLPDFIKIVATEVSGTATCTVKVVPINV